MAMVLSALTGCGAASPEDTRDERLAGLASDLQPIIPQLMELSPGLYSAIEIGSFITIPGQIDGAPDGQVAVLTYSYTYAQSVMIFDWWDKERLLQEQSGVLDDVCESQVLPSMRESGIEGPLGVRYFYRNGSEGAADEYWEHWCWSEN